MLILIFYYLHTKQIFSVRVSGEAAKGGGYGYDFLPLRSRTPSLWGLRCHTHQVYLRVSAGISLSLTDTGFMWFNSSHMSSRITHIHLPYHHHLNGGFRDDGWLAMSLLYPSNVSRERAGFI